MECEFDNIIDNVKDSYIAKSTVHGNGLFASKEIKKGECLGFLDGQYISTYCINYFFIYSIL